jgi:hypothetical protein
VELLLAEVALPLSYAGIWSQRTDSNRQQTITHELRPIEKARRIRNGLGVSCSALELLRNSAPEAGLEPATTSSSAITQSNDPSKVCGCCRRGSEAPRVEGLRTSPLPSTATEAAADKGRAFRAGQEAGIRTRTVALTTRSAAVTPQSCWSPWSDSHRRIRVYATRPVAAEGTGAKWRPRQELHPRPPPSHGGALNLTELPGQNGIRGRTRTG